MVTEEQSGGIASPEAPDPELEEHLAALGLKTVEEYVRWCAQNGFSVRTEKHWRQRCKERYFASRQEIRTRWIRNKRESRHPHTTILRIANNELSAADLTRPHLVSIAEAFASLEGGARDAFLWLLLHAQGCADLFVMGPVVRQFGALPGNTFIDALSALARHHDSWLRPVERWKPRTHNTRRQLSSLARHLLARYPVPEFMDSVWFKGTTAEARQQQGWFLQIASGKSPRHLDLPVHLTKRMVHHFIRAPSDYTVEAALRWGQVHGLGGRARLVEAILGSKLATDFDHEDFWVTVIRWMIANPMLDTRHVAPIVDYVHYQKFEPQQLVATADETGPRPPQPDFSIKGRTPASLLRQIGGWHGELRKPSPQARVEWYESGIGEFDWIEGTAASKNLRRWTIKELLSRKELFAEGCAMRHCVASYEHSCASGRGSIWSMGLQRKGGRRRRVLTVEVDPRMRVICQARGKTNRLPTAKEVSVLCGWAAQEGLTLAEHVGSR